jgi:hypothetical protein
VLLFTGCACTTHGESFLCPAVDACQTIAWSAERLAEGTVVGRIPAQVSRRHECLRRLPQLRASRVRGVELTRLVVGG